VMVGERANIEEVNIEEVHDLLGRSGSPP